ALKRDLPPPAATLFAAPGNPGTAQLGTNLPIPAGGVLEVVKAVEEHRSDLTIAGPEAPLAPGPAPRLPERGQPSLAPRPPPPPPCASVGRRCAGPAPPPRASRPPRRSPRK